MKTFRMIGIALFAVLMCVNFAACSGDDEEPGNGGDVPEVSKKLMEISGVTDDGNDWAYQFTYDGNQLASCKYDGTSYTYTWGEGLIIEKDKWGSDKYTLTDGLISKTDYVGFTYNSSKQLISQDYGNGRQNYTWTNGKLTKIVDTDNDGNIDETIEFTYGNQTCKGFFPLLNEYTDVD